MLPNLGEILQILFLYLQKYIFIAELAFLRFPAAVRNILFCAKITLPRVFPYLQAISFLFGY